MSPTDFPFSPNELAQEGSKETDSPQATDRRRSESLNPGDPEVEMHRAWRRPPIARLTFFHTLILLGVAVAATVFYHLGAVIGAGLAARLTLGLVGALFGVPASFAGTVAFVLGFVVPRLSRFSFWAYEVNCFMLSVLGEKWASAGHGSKTPSTKSGA